MEMKLFEVRADQDRYYVQARDLVEAMREALLAMVPWDEGRPELELRGRLLPVAEAGGIFVGLNSRSVAHGFKQATKDRARVLCSSTR